MANEEMKSVEEQVADILKPTSFGAAQEARPRPMMSVVEPERAPPVAAAPAAPEAALAPHLTVTEHLAMLESQNAETRQLVTERSDAIELALSTRIADVERLLQNYMDVIEAKLNAVLTTLR